MAIHIDDKQKWPVIIPTAPAPTPQILSGTLAARPAFGVADRYYWATDVQMLFRDTGVAWQIASAGIQACEFIMDERRKQTPIGAAAPIVVNEVELTPVIIPFTCTVDAICHHTENPAAGNTYKGIYQDNGRTPQGGALLAQAGPQTNANTYKLYTDALAATVRLTPGLYWLAAEWQTATNAMHPVDYDTGNAPNLLQPYYYVLGAFGALTDPCPAVAIAGGSPALSLRVLSIP